MYVYVTLRNVTLQDAELGVATLLLVNCHSVRQLILHCICCIENKAIA